MLLLTRRVGETLNIGDKITVNQPGSEIDEIMINPSSKDTVCIDLDSFFDLFAIKNNSNDWIFEKARPLNQEVKVYYREFEPLMKKQAIGGVYSSKNPFSCICPIKL